MNCCLIMQMAVATAPALVVEVLSSLRLRLARSHVRLWRQLLTYKADLEGSFARGIRGCVRAASVTRPQLTIRIRWPKEMLRLKQDFLSWIP